MVKADQMEDMAVAGRATQTSNLLHDTRQGTAFCIDVE
jgi:hypothetical protein